MLDRFLISRFLLLLILSGSFLSCGVVSHPRRPSINSRIVAHALGLVNANDSSGSNCKECFVEHYKNGTRFFEADFVKTSDGKIVAMHNGFESKLGLKETFTLKEFLSSKIDDRYTPIDIFGIADLMNEHKDWFLITDVKQEDNYDALKLICEALAQKHVSCEDRVIPQFYNFADVGILDKIKFKRSILTLYRMGNVQDQVVAFLKHEKRISAVTMWSSWVNPGFVKQCSELGVQVFTHTVNRKDEADGLFAQGVSGVYSDLLKPSDFPNDPFMFFE